MLRPFEHALEDFAGVEKDRVVPAPAGGDEAVFQVSRDRIVRHGAHHALAGFDPGAADHAASSRAMRTAAGGCESWNAEYTGSGVSVAALSS